MKSIFTDSAPEPAGHYSQALEHNGIVYVSGQLPVKAGSKEMYVGTIEEQAKQALANLEAILNQANSGKDCVLKVTVYVSDISLWPKVNSVYAAFFGDHKPARAIVPTKELHFGYQIEVEAIAYVRK